MGREGLTSSAIAEMPEAQISAPESKESVELLCRFEGQVDKWKSGQSGVVIESQGNLLLNGSESLLPEGIKYEEWYLTPEGVILRNGKDFSIKRFDTHSIEPIFSGTEEYRGCYEFPDGVAIRDHNKTFINGETEINTKDTCKRTEYVPNGVIGESASGIRLYGPEGKRTWLHEGKIDPDKLSWRPHPYQKGVVLENRKNSSLSLATDASHNPQEICTDDFMSWEPCVQGIVGIKNEGGLYYYAVGGHHQRLVEGYPDYQIHPEGVIVRNDTEWQLIKVEK